RQDRADRHAGAFGLAEAPRGRDTARGARRRDRPGDRSRPGRRLPAAALARGAPDRAPRPWARRRGRARRGAPLSRAGPRAAPLSPRPRSGALVLPTSVLGSARAPHVRARERSCARSILCRRRALGCAGAGGAPRRRLSATMRGLRRPAVAVLRRLPELPGRAPASVVRAVRGPGPGVRTARPRLPAVGD